ncbi:carboxymuconolactone decarboxylase family protein [Phenylobacterium sp.]|jgi:4-carboxymuconolactone decarboxylase|uniref:carboxymuconolactone decarboxylase family protein n=1 Tax=Phenylobacterium sp. TaxID=1871053 RepID=UPI002F423643
MGYREDRSALGDKTLEQMFGAGPTARSTPLLNSKRDFVGAEVWTRPGLTLQERWLITLTCVAQASNAAENDRYVHGALRSKALTLQEMREFVLHFAVYCGWSKAELLDEAVSRAADALGLEEPAEPPALSLEPAERQARGVACWLSVMTFPPSPPNEPYTSAGILNFVFGEMWDRPGLGRKARRFVTMAAVGLNDANSPIMAHVYASLKSGDVSLAEMEEFILQFALYAGWPKASEMQGCTRQVAKRMAEGASLFG